MTEFTPQAPEHFEALPSPEQHEALPTPEQAEPLRPGEQDPRQTLQEARQAVQEQAQAESAAAALKAAEKPQDTAPPLPPNRALKDMALKRELRNLQRQLPATSRSLSKLIHTPAVRAVSEAGARTVSRPSGLLGGGLVAFAGSLGYLITASQVGFTYNYLVFLMLFVVGFAAGVAGELALWLALRRK